MVKKIVIAIIILNFFSCSLRDNADKIYNEKYYQRVSVKEENSTSQEGYEVLIYTLDTSRKMIKYYWDNGNVQAVSFYYNGKKDGIWTRYFEDGRLSFAGRFFKGTKEGMHKLYFSNGKISIAESYIYGKKAGIWFYYDTSGNLIKTEHY